MEPIQEDEVFDSEATRMRDPEAEANLYITIHAAQDLLPKDLNGFSDPFVRIEIDGCEVGHTRVMERNLNPVWNQEFVIPIHEVPDSNAQKPLLKLDVRNFYKFGKITGAIQNVGKQAFLGQIEVPLSSLLLNDGESVQPEWFTLQKRSERSNVRGQIQVSMYLVKKDNKAPSRINLLDSRPQRRLSHITVSELAAHANVRNAKLTESGSYVVNAELVKAFEVFCINDSAAMLHFSLSISDEKIRTKPVSNSNIDANGALLLGNMKLTLLHHYQQGFEIPTITLSLHIRRGVLPSLTLGHTTIPLDAIPVLGADASDQIEPVDLFIEKKKWKLLPPNIKLRNAHGSLCRLRVKLWLSRINSSEELEDLSPPPGDIIRVSSSLSIAPELELEDVIAPEPIVFEPPNPADLPAPLEWALLDLPSIPVSVEQLSALLFEENSPFYAAFCRERNSSELITSPWTENKREISYMLPKSAIVKANRCYEKQAFTRKDPNLHIFTSTATNPDVPYGKDFETRTLFVLSALTSTTSHLTITAEMIFSRSPLVKSMIRSSAKSAMGATFVLYGDVLQRFSRSAQASAAASRIPSAQTQSTLSTPVPISAASAAHQEAVAPAEPSLASSVDAVKAPVEKPSAGFHVPQNILFIIIALQFVVILALLLSRRDQEL